MMRPVVLVHGAWHGAWCFERVTARLCAEGYQVHVPALTALGERAHLLGPGISLATHVTDVAEVKEGNSLQDIVLCGNSSSGAVI
jgi:dienelactone hydrolase